MVKYVLALDQGTTSSRAIVFDHDGSIVSVAQQEFPQIYPAPGLVEHDPEAIWSSQLAVARQALQEANASAADIAALGITNQRETALVWEKSTGKPVFNAIVWQSRLTVPICDALKAKGFDKEIRERTGLVTDAYFSGTKVKWILDNIPGVREQAQRGEVLFGNVDTFLMWRLSKGHVHATDPSNASRTLLYNIYQGDWDDVILDELEIPRVMLPTVMPSSGAFGETDPEFFGGPIKMAGDAGDQQAATFGQTCYEVGMAKNTYGTGSFMLMNTGSTGVPSHSGLLTTIAWGIGDQITYALEGSILVTRWPQSHYYQRRCRSPGRHRTRYRRRLPRSRFRWAGRSVLGSLRTRHHRWPDARLNHWTYCTRDAGVDVLSNARCAGGDDDR